MFSYSNKILYKDGLAVFNGTLNEALNDERIYALIKKYFKYIYKDKTAYKEALIPLLDAQEKHITDTIYDNLEILSGFYCLNGLPLCKLNTPIQEIYNKLMSEINNTSNSSLAPASEHYTKQAIQPLDVMKENFTESELEGFYKGNVLKYVMRYHLKNGLEDLKKARYYLSSLIELETNK